MRPPAPLLFLAATLGLWMGVRATLLIGDRAAAAPTVRLVALANALPPLMLRGMIDRRPPERHALSLPAARPAGGATPAFVRPIARPASVAPRVRAEVGPWPSRGETDLLLLASYAQPPAVGGDRLVAPEGWIGPVATRRDRIAGSAWIFERAGAGRRAIAPGGQLGGSQFGVRATLRLDRAGRLALAARASGPRRDPGAIEAAIGIDWHPDPTSTARLSVERRMALGLRGRDAWSAYAAAGFYAEPAPQLMVDGYAQAGIVGLKRRDLFADGAVRGGGKLPIGPREDLVLGAGAWGAAQPDLARLDIGPRAAIGLPIGSTRASLALEGRFRIAGRADPGSGLALTLATDF